MISILNSEFLSFESSITMTNDSNTKLMRGLGDNGLGRWRLLEDVDFERLSEK